MKERPAYKLVEALTAADLSQQVNDHIKDGWTPIQNAFGFSDACNNYYLQPMVKS